MVQGLYQHSSTGVRLPQKPPSPPALSAGIHHPERFTISASRSRQYPNKDLLERLKIGVRNIFERFLQIRNHQLKSGKKVLVKLSFQLLDFAEFLG